MGFTSRDRIGLVESPSGNVEMFLDRVQRGQGDPIWLFSSSTLQEIPRLYDEVQPPWIERYVPERLRTIQWLSVPLYRWIAILLLHSPGLRSRRAVHPRSDRVCSVRCSAASRESRTTASWQAGGHCACWFSRCFSTALRSSASAWPLGTSGFVWQRPWRSWLCAGSRYVWWTSWQS